MADQDIAHDLHQQAMDLHDAGDEEQALALYQRALELDDDRPSTYYNIGLIHKYRGLWAESQRANQRAVDLDDGHEAANWNLAIAATANHDWRTARDVWQRLGMSVEPGDTPISKDFGHTPVRLNPQQGGEVVWGQRIDPVRVRIVNIPYGESGYRYGDVVLHDGAAVGERELNGHRYPVFNVLELFEASDNQTFEAELHVSDLDDVDDLLALLVEHRIAGEDWSRSIRLLCKQCSEGVPHSKHDHEEVPFDEHQPIRLVAIAGPDEALIRTLLARWSDDRRHLLRLECVLGKTSLH
ncbi:tetratricopeptide repeat protein [Pseudomonas sp. LRF_L74]|uniref:tetratricopeptide repeat protein n=1 Tax=Pseudomonas sp. LRF_L74 TaxID=3369422 RepID=UPI003F6433D1